MMRKINTHAIFIAALFALSLFFLNGILYKGTILDNVHYINDLTFLSYNTKSAIKNNEFPLWTPYFYSGHPLLAIPENYMFDLNFLFIYLFRNIYLAMNLALIFYFFLAGLSMYLLAFNIVDNKKAAFISAIIYMFNGFMHTFIIGGHINILAGYALIPFILLFVYKALKGKEWLFYSILAGIFFALQIFSGSLIFFFYTALLVLFYLAFNLISKNFNKVLIKSAFIGVVIILTALSLASIKLLPVLEFTKMSSRAVNVSFNEFLGHPINLKDFARIAITNMGYSGLSAGLGVIGFILMAWGLFDCKKKMVIFCAFVMVFSFLFASGTFVSDIMYKVPGFDKQRHIERSLVLFVFAGSVLPAYGFVLLSEKLKKYNFYFQHKNLFFAGIAFLILLELLLLQNMPIGTKVLEPHDIKVLSYMSSDNSTFRTINLAQKDIIGAAGYNYYAQEGISEVKGGGGIWINDYVVFLSIAQQSMSSKIFGILNVKYIVSEDKLEAANITLVDRFNVCKECAVWNAFGPYLYKNQLFLPRYYVVPNSVLVVGDNAIVKQIIYSLMLNNLRHENTVLLEGTKIDDYSLDFLKKFNIIFLARGSVEQNSIAKLREYATQGGLIVPDILNGQNSVSNEQIISIFNTTKGTYTQINIHKYSNNEVALNLNGEKGWLTASERFAHFTGWRASINGKKVGILKADNVISAIYLDGEKGKLIFEYKPNSYRKGKSISIAAFVLILAYFAYFSYKKSYKKKFKLGGSNQA